MLLRVFITIGFFTIISSVFSQTKWELAKEKNGIKVFTSLDGTSKFKSIKVEAVLAGTLDKLTYLFLDAASNKDWIYNTKESYIIKRISPLETLSYTETSVPWPASNRDIPIQTQLKLDAKNNTLKVVARGVPDALAVKKGIVRIPFFNSLWNVKYDGKSKLFISYFLEMDPGGSVPAWITNMFVAKGPYETFYNLARVLK
jgi:hypothetical protein